MERGEATGRVAVDEKIKMLLARLDAFLDAGRSRPAHEALIDRVLRRPGELSITSGRVTRRSHDMLQIYEGC